MDEAKEACRGIFFIFIFIQKSLWECVWTRTSFRFDSRPGKIQAWSTKRMVESHSTRNVTKNDGMWRAECHYIQICFAGQSVKLLFLFRYYLSNEYLYLIHFLVHYTTWLKSRLPFNTWFSTYHVSTTCEIQHKAKQHKLKIEPTTTSYSPNKQKSSSYASKQKVKQKTVQLFKIDPLSASLMWRCLH